MNQGNELFNAYTSPSFYDAVIASTEGLSGSMRDNVLLMVQIREMIESQKDTILNAVEDYSRSGIGGYYYNHLIELEHAQDDNSYEDIGYDEDPKDYESASSPS